MKEWVILSMSLMNIILTIIKILPTQSSQRCKYFFYKALLYFVSFLFLISTYVFGAMAFYSFLVPYWGVPLSAFALCLLSLIISSSLIITGMLLKPKKKKPSPQILPFLEKSLDHLPNAQDLVKTLNKASPAILLTVLGVAAVTTCIVLFKKNHK